MRKLLFILPCVLLPACVVGPSASQNAAGQKITNSPLDTTTMTITPDGTNTFVATARGPVRESLVDSEGIEARSTGMVTRDLTFVLSPDGTKRFSLASGSDISATGFRMNPVTGLVEVQEFSTISSEPLRALNESLAHYKDVWSKLSDDQRRTFEAQLDTVKLISPDLFDALKAILTGGVL